MPHGRDTMPAIESSLCGATANDSMVVVTKNSPTSASFGLTRGWPSEAQMRKTRRWNGGLRVWGVCGVQSMLICTHAKLYEIVQNWLLNFSCKAGMLARCLA